MPSLFDQLKALTTEQQNPRTLQIDTASTEEIVRLINAEDQTVALAVEAQLPYVVQAVEKIVAAFKNGGRLFYVGAGTSGRLGVVDASECPPTFGTPPELVQGLIAGGPQAMFAAKEGAEDVEANGRDALVEAGVTERDVVCGIASSGRTPYVIGAVKYAKELGCDTLFVACVPRTQFPAHDVTDVAICVEVGQEPIMGSTRMKSGTAQKMVLNMLTTASMVRLGKVYQNMMVDLQMTNQKLVERSRRIVITVTGVDYDAATEALAQADGHVKTALVLLLTERSAEEARVLLAANDGFVRRALEATQSPS